MITLRVLNLKSVPAESTFISPVKASFLVANQLLKAHLN